MEGAIWVSIFPMLHRELVGARIEFPKCMSGCVVLLMSMVITLPVVDY